MQDVRKLQPTKQVVPEPPDALYEKPLPNNRDAERLILGVILLDNEVITQAIERIKPEDFFLESHRHIYQAMLTIYNGGDDINPITVQEELRRDGLLEKVGGPAYIASLFDGVPRFSNIESYLKIVKGKSTLRKIARTGAQIQSLAFDDALEAEEIVEMAARAVFDIADDNHKKSFTHVSPVVVEQLERAEEASQRESMITGIRTGFTGIDYMTCGLQRGDLLIIAARPSMGKTALATDIGKRVALSTQDHGGKGVVGIFSLEMSKEQLGFRLLCSQAMIDAERLRTGRLKDTAEWRKAALAVHELSEAPLFIDDTPGITVMDMRAKARRLKHQQKGILDLLIVDYLQLMAGGGKRHENRQQEISTISRELKILAKELNVPLIALSQLSRAPETRTGNHKPQLSDLRESGSIEQDADVVMFIYREEVYQPETTRQNIADIIIGKQRNGPTGVVELVFLKQITAFQNPYHE